MILYELFRVFYAFCIMHYALFLLYTILCAIDTRLINATSLLAFCQPV